MRNGGGGLPKRGVQQITAWSLPLCPRGHRAVGRSQPGESPVVVDQAHRRRLLLRRVASRRRGRCALSLVSAMLSLLHQDSGLYDPSRSPAEAQIRCGFSKCVLTSGGVQ